jgi:hypothetical protein
MMASLQRNRGEKRVEVNSGSCGIIMASPPSEEIQLSKEVRTRAGTTTETEINNKTEGIAEPNSYLLWLEDEYRKNKLNLDAERMPLSPRKVYYNRTSSAEALPSTVRMTRRGAIVPSSPRSVSFSFSDSQICIIYISLCSFQSRQYAR